MRYGTESTIRRLDSVRTRQSPTISENHLGTARCRSKRMLYDVCQNLTRLSRITRAGLGRRAYRTRTRLLLRFHREGLSDYSRIAQGYKSMRLQDFVAKSATRSLTIHSSALCVFSRLFLGFPVDLQTVCHSNFSQCCEDISRWVAHGLNFVRKPQHETHFVH